MTSAAEQSVGELTTSRCLEAVRFLLSLNNNVDFSTHKNLNEFIYTARSGIVTPEVEMQHLATGSLSSLQKHKQVQSIGFHLLDRGSKWLCCRLTAGQKANRRLEALLGRLKEAYVEMELVLMQHPCEKPD